MSLWELAWRIVDTVYRFIIVVWMAYLFVTGQYMQMLAIVAFFVFVDYMTDRLNW